LDFKFMFMVFFLPINFFFFLIIIITDDLHCNWYTHFNKYSRETSLKAIKSSTERFIWAHYVNNDFCLLMENDTISTKKISFSGSGRVIQTYQK
jgi:hypothetical protein